MLQRVALVLGLCTAALLLVTPAPRRAWREQAPVIAQLPAASTRLHRPGRGLPAWGADGAQLLYLGPDKALMRLRLDAPDRPERMAEPPVSDGIPSGGSVVYVGVRATPDQPTAPMTLFLQGGTSAPVDLLPGDAAIHGTSTVKHIHRWITPSVLAYEESVGTGASQLFLLDLDTKRLMETPRLAATSFLWSKDGTRLAGQWIGGPPQFWLWDRTTGEFIPTGELPGQFQQVEAWSEDGESVLFTAWEGGWPYQDRTPTLYRLDLKQERLELIAAGAALAVWTKNHLAYLRLEPEMSLVVTESQSGTELWRESLGPRPEGGWEQFRPAVAGSYLGYRTAQNQYWVTPVAMHDPRLLYGGESFATIWASDGEHVAVLSDNREPRLLVVRNPHLEP